MQDVGPLTMAVVAMVALDALWMPAVLLGHATFPATYATHVVPAATSIDLAQVAFRLATMVLFCVWLYAAGRRLEELGVEGLEFTPASRIWWFFIPILNLFRPFQGMRELDNASRGVVPYDLTSGLIGGWWALWLTSNVAGRLLARSDGTDYVVPIIVSVVELALSVAAILLVLRIAAGQARMSQGSLADVFA